MRHVAKFCPVILERKAKELAKKRVGKIKFGFSKNLPSITKPAEEIEQLEPEF